jgi:hypothetical protein
MYFYKLKKVLFFAGHHDQISQTEGRPIILHENTTKLDHFIKKNNSYKV